MPGSATWPSPPLLSSPANCLLAALTQTSFSPGRPGSCSRELRGRCFSLLQVKRAPTDTADVKSIPSYTHTHTLQTSVARVGAVMEPAGVKALIPWLVGRDSSGTAERSSIPGPYAWSSFCLEGFPPGSTAPSLPLPTPSSHRPLLKVAFPGLLSHTWCSPSTHPLVSPWQAHPAIRLPPLAL